MPTSTVAMITKTFEITNIFKGRLGDPRACDQVEGSIRSEKYCAVPAKKLVPKASRR